MIRITACQTKRGKSSERNLEACVKWIEKIAQNERTDLICFGETYPFSFDIPGNLDEDKRVTLLKQVCRESRSSILIGYVEQAGDKIRNLAVLINQAGEIIHRHAKDVKYGDEKQKLAPGSDKTQVVRYQGANIGLSICYSLLFPEYGRMLALQGSQLVIAQSNVPSSIRDVWHSVLLTRVFENHLPYVHVSAFDERRDYSGLTCIITPPFTKAEEIQDPFEEGFITAALDLRKYAARRFAKAPEARGPELFREGEYGPFLSELPENILEELMKWYPTLRSST